MFLPLQMPDLSLNERHYGSLTGLNKAETAAKHGEALVKIWRHSYDIPPPPMTFIMSLARYVRRSNYGAEPPYRNPYSI
ncbi:hypothetical protein P4O66_013647 [Electrophorus voltai]|uniref:phosphoglycerate mutase (2,3-diphosphoglycerate-dependent) n=1 Tax=Electrophorus voltai TaxID=2609070 RepID=A0AAD8Z363_9TELE|nr:hypothetical protein P4O66_013647 [Electrophorus voltai]